MADPGGAYEVIRNVPTNHGPTWGFRCLTCGNGTDGYIKERYAHDDARQHAASHSPDLLAPDAR